jgi:hypothetical protein
LKAEARTRARSPSKEDASLTSSNVPLVSVAVEALEGARRSLQELPLSSEVRALLERSLAIRTVLHGVVMMRQPELSEDQRGRLLAQVSSLSIAATKLRDRMSKHD